MATPLFSLGKLLTRSRNGRPRRVHYHTVLTPDEFRTLLIRERALVDRNSHSFSLVTVTVPLKCPLSESELFKMLAHRVRLTDDIGWIDDKRLALLLRFTGENGAWKLAQDVAGSLTVDGTPPVCRVHTYPSDGKDGMEGPHEDPRQQNFIDLCPDWMPRESNGGASILSASRSVSSGEADEFLASMIAHPVPLYKRVTDIALSLLVLAFLAPLMLLLALYIKIVSPGPIFFRQERIGYRGLPFLCWKFRTMHHRADVGVHQKHLKDLIKSNTAMTKLDSRKDNRLIPGARLLRGAGLDELPQIFNVIKGEMSLIGPRPCIRYEYEQYDRWHKQRFSTLPGITGLWQVSGKNRTTFAEMMRMDVKYAHRKNFWTDVLIFFRTIPTLMSEAMRAVNSEKK